jgi:hypothetical protein
VDPLFSVLRVPPRSVAVRSKASLGHEVWVGGSANHLLFNVQLRAKECSAQEAEQYPAHVAAADLAGNSRFFGGGSQQQVASSGAVEPVVLPLDVQQQQLHAAVEALYSGCITLAPYNIGAPAHALHARPMCLAARRACRLAAVTRQRAPLCPLASQPGLACWLRTPETTRRRSAQRRC